MWLPRPHVSLLYCTGRHVHKNLLLCYNTCNKSNDCMYSTYVIHVKKALLYVYVNVHHVAYGPRCEHSIQYIY